MSLLCTPIYTKPRYNRTVSLNSIKKLLTTVLHLNKFQFNRKHYLQYKWVGLTLEPDYTNLCMDRLEKKTSEITRKYKPEYNYICPDNY